MTLGLVSGVYLDERPGGPRKFGKNDDVGRRQSDPHTRGHDAEKGHAHSAGV